LGATKQRENAPYFLRSGGSAADVPESAIGWRGGRAAASCLRFSGPASGVAGDRGNDLGGARRDEGQAPSEHDAQFVKRAHSRAA
jgi:hypothetical protein